MIFRLLIDTTNTDPVALDQLLDFVHKHKAPSYFVILNKRTIELSCTLSNIYAENFEVEKGNIEGLFNALQCSNVDITDYEGN